MTVKARRQLEQCVDSHVGDSLNCRGPLRRPFRHCASRNSCDGNSIPEYVELIFRLCQRRGGGDNQMKLVASVRSR